MLKILLVEDQKQSQTLIRELVDHLTDFEIVAIVETESQAQEWVANRGHAWDIALVDLVLREGSGFNVIQRCKQRRPDAKVIVFSEFASPAVQERCRQIGADEAIAKADFDQLHEVLDSLRSEA